jgi:hypothetical protein
MKTFSLALRAHPLESDNGGTARMGENKAGFCPYFTGNLKILINFYYILQNEIGQDTVI